MINKKVFSQAISSGAMAIALGSLMSFAASAEPTNALDIANAFDIELAQAPATSNREMTIQERTLVFSQTDQIALRVYNGVHGIPRFNLYNKQTGITEVQGGPVAVETTEMGVTYRHTGEQTVEIAIANSGEQTITLNGRPQQASETVSGTVFYLPRIALPPNAMIDVSLLDVSRADAIATTLASAKITANGRQVPFPFELLYDAGQIDPRYSYAVQSRITVDGDLQFINTTRIPVITNGNPTEGVEVQVDPVNQPDNPPTDPPINQGAVEPSQLTGTVWQLEQIQYNNDEQITATDGDYTIEFLADGRLSIRADCNQVLGSFTTDTSRSLSVDLGPTTLAACRPDSVDTEYLQALQNAGLYFFEEGDLYIDLQADTGTMRFSSQQ